MRQSVIVGGSLSPPLGNKRGATQGSILGYLMYGGTVGYLSVGAQ